MFLEFFFCLDVVIEVIKLGILVLNVTLDLLFLPNECLFHCLGIVGVVSDLSDDILLVSNDFWELGGHDLGIRLV